jgi:hypothetical protein
MVSQKTYALAGFEHWSPFPEAEALSTAPLRPGPAKSKLLSVFCQNEEEFDTARVAI